MKSIITVLFILVITPKYFAQSNNSNGEDVSFLNEFTLQNADDIKTRQTVKNLLSRQAVYHNIDYHSNSNLLAFSRADRSLEIRDMNTAQSYCINTTRFIDRVLFSPNGKYLAGTVTWDNTIIKSGIPEISLFDVTGKKWLWNLNEKTTITKNYGYLNRIIFSPDGERMVVLFEQRMMYVDCDSGYVVKEFETSTFNKFKFPSKYYFTEDFQDLRFKNSNEVEFVTSTIFINYNAVKKILGMVIPFIKSNTTYTNVVNRFKMNISTGEVISSEVIKGFELPSNVTPNTFMRDEFVLSYFSNNNQLGIAHSKAEEPDFIQFPGAISDIEMDTTAKIMYYTLKYNSAIFRYDYQNKKELASLKDHSSPASDIELAPTKNWIISSDVNGIKNFWNKSTGELLFRVYSDDNAEYMISTPKNYYQCSKGALKDLRFMKGNSIYRFESYDLILNRPDLILKSIGTSDQALLANFEKAVKIRSEKLKIDLNADPDNLNLPVLTIKNKKDLTISTTTTQLVLEVSAEDKNSFVKELVVYVNGTENQRIPFTKKEKSVSQKITVKLNSGSNFIELAALNENGNESLRENHEVVCSATIPQKIYFLGIGVSNYKDNEFSLKYAAKDVRDLVKYFKNEYGKNLVIDTLIDKNATIENIRKSVLKLNKCSENDLVIVSLNGHGLLDKNYNFYFGTHDVDFMDPSLKGLSYTEIDKLFSGIKSRNRLVLIDACHSGELDVNEVGEKVTPSSTPAKEVKFRGAEKLQTYSKISGVSTYQLMRDFFSDLSNQTGAHVISAAGGFEYAMESDQWSNGIFTYSVLAGLKEKLADADKNGSVTVTELQRFVYTNVMSLTNGKQLPTSRKSNVRNDFGLNKK